MPATQQKSSSHAPFQMGFVYTAIAIAILGGFGIGAHLTFIIGYEMPLHRGFQAYIQLHGHLQLVGWAGLFILGFSLHILPRLASTHLPKTWWPTLVLVLTAGGITLRAVAHSILPYVDAAGTAATMRSLVVLSAILEFAGIGTYVFAAGSVLKTGSLAAQPRLRQIRPFLMLALFGWASMGISNLVLVLGLANHGGDVIHFAWNGTAVHAFIILTLLPTAFVFSVRMLPFYLKIEPIHRGLSIVAGFYAIFVITELAAGSPAFEGTDVRNLERVRLLSSIGRDLVILIFIARLGLWNKRKPVWQATFGPDAPFGRFDRLIRTAYIWLAIGAVLEIGFAIFVLAGEILPQATDIVRHCFLMGFISFLIFGVAVRAVPGFLGAKKIAIPAMVDATFWLGLAAASLRTIPLLLALPQFSNLPLLRPAAEWGYAWSGMFAVIAVFLLGLNLLQTHRRVRAAEVRSS